MAVEKVQVRKIMSARRGRLSPAERERLSRMACQSLLASPLWRQASVMGLFVSLPAEISTCQLLDQAWREGKEVYLPKINPLEKGHMDFYKCTAWSELKKGRFGLMEPDGFSATLSDADLMIVPGLAFDRSGNRLGYGGGYYDRYLGMRPQLAKRCAGLAYAFQILDFLDSDKYDCKMSFLCTEEGIIWSSA